jgi:nitroreductase
MFESYGDPSGRFLLKIASEYAMPSYVAEADSEGDLAHLSSDAFADNSRRVYPIHNQAAVWVSMAKFASDKGSMEPWRAFAVASRLRKAAAEQGVAEPERLPTPAETPAGLIKTAGLTVDAGTTEKWLRAVDALQDQKGKLTAGMRMELAGGLLKSAAADPSKLSKESSDYLARASGDAIGSMPRIKEAIAARMAYANPGHAELIEPLGALLDKVASATQLDRGQAAGVIGMLDLADRAMGLNLRYAEGFKTPEEAVYAMSMDSFNKFAAEAVPLQNGTTVARSELQSKEAAIKTYFKDFLGSEYPGFDEAVAVVSSLPRSEASTFCELLDEADA